MSRFDELKRERLLVLMEAGQTVEQACAAAGVGRATVTRWVRAGRKPDAPADVREFSRRYSELREAARPSNGNGNGHGLLTDEQLLAVLEDSARRGSAEAAKMLLSRRQRQERTAEEAHQEPAFDPYRMALEGDPFVAASPDELALLTPEQRGHVLAMAEAQRGSGDPRGRRLGRDQVL
jgi:hypothetical protein